MKSALQLGSWLPKTHEELGGVSKNLVIKFLASQKPTHNKMHMSSRSHGSGESFKIWICVGKPRSSHISKLFPGCTIVWHCTARAWNLAICRIGSCEAAWMTPLLWQLCLYFCKPSVERYFSEIFPLQRIGVFWWSTKKLISLPEIQYRKQSTFTTCCPCFDNTELITVQIESALNRSKFLYAL